MHCQVTLSIPKPPHLSPHRQCQFIVIQTVLVLEIALTHVWDLAHGLVDPQFGSGPSLQPAHSPVCE